MAVDVRVFISYDTAQALGHARDAKSFLKECGFSGWVWQDDRSALGYKQTEMAKRIRWCDYFLLICTEATAGSQTQTYEREMAWHYNKVPPAVITFDGGHVPEEWQCYHYTEPSKDLEAQCADICADLLQRQKLIRGVHQEVDGQAFMVGRARIGAQPTVLNDESL